MNKQEYLNQLAKYLCCLPKDDFEAAMDHFTEYFEDAGPEGEAKVIEELGTPKEASYELLSKLLETKDGVDLGTHHRSEANKNGYSDSASKGSSKDDPVERPVVSNKGLSSGNILLIAIIALLAAPIGIPLLLLMLLFLISMIALVGAGIVTVIAVVAATFAGSIQLIYNGFIAISTSASAALSLVGLGIAGIGVSILAGIVVFYIIKFCIKAIVAFIRWVIKKGRKK